MDIFDLLTPPGHPDRIGDPSTLGWVIFFTYFVASLTCGYTGWYSKRKYSRYRGCSDLRSDTYWVWYPLTALLLLLGFNKQLDLQTWLRWFGEKATKYLGMYEHRRIVEAIFVVCLAILCFGVIGFWIWRLRKRLKRYGPTILGMICLCLFVVVRSAHFNHVFTTPEAPALFRGYGNPIHLFELCSLILIILGALSHRFRPKRSHHLKHIP